jgi:hypothetical protein
VPLCGRSRRVVARARTAAALRSLNAALGYVSFALSMTLTRLAPDDPLTERFGSMSIVRDGAICTAAFAAGSTQTTIPAPAMS